jgi:hypothetical protein
VVCVDSFKPVCWEDGKTYSNVCVAEKVNSIQVAYEWECKTEVKAEVGTWENIWENNLWEISESWVVSSWTVAPITDIPKPTEIIEKPTADYFKNLRAQCNEESCCLSSVDTMEQKWYKEAADDKCPAGYDTDLLKCEWSYKWCIKSDKPLPTSATWSTVIWGLSYFNSNFNYWFTLPARTYFSGYSAQWWANHAVWISTSSWSVNFWDNAVKVYFFKWKILPELQDSHYWLYEDPKNGRTYMELSGNSIIIEASSWNEAIVQSIVKSVYVK